jgi:bifunctional non-homologous end joining protein LigD
VTDPLPQRPTPARAEIASVDWLVEPHWHGVRAVARLDAGGVHLADDLPGVADALRAALRAESAVIDGIWTEQPVAGEDRRAFVAIDILELDGESLLDVPLLERRRLLESVITESDEVRLSPVVKHPIGGWLLTWQSLGFTHVVAKHQNARYTPGEQNEDWLKIPIVVEPTGGFVGRLIGSRERLRRIGD